MTPSTVAFTLREAYAGTVEVLDGEGNPTGEQTPKYLGGLLRAGDRDLDVRKLLDEGNGTITVDAAAEPLVVAVLDEYPPLKRTTADEAAPVTYGYADRNAKDLKREVARRGIEGNGSKPDLVTALEVDDARQRAGLDRPDEGYTVAALVSGDLNPGDPNPSPEA
jgi:hypothetical protein